MDIILEKFMLTQEEIKNLNRSITSKQVELVIKKNSPQDKPGPRASLVNFTEVIEKN